MKRFYIFALVAMMFAACTTDKTQDLQPVDAPKSLTVGFEENTRIQLNSAGKTVWTKDDFVSVFYRSDANQKWQFQGETGERTGLLKRVSTPEATMQLSDVIVAYPYSEEYYINPKTCNIQAYLPATQSYLKDSFGLDGNLMVSAGEYNQIYLKNVCGWLKLQLTGEGEMVQSITLKGNNGEQVAGSIYVDTETATATLAAETNGDYEDGVGGTLVFDDAILTEVTLNCGNGVELGSSAKSFYIALPPQTFEKGLTVEIETTEGKIMTKSTDKSLTIERNVIQPMAAVAYNGIFKPANNEIYYTNGSTTEATAPNRTNVFGANIVSNLYDAEKECWVMTFDGYVTSIGVYAFKGCTSLTSIAISDSVTSIGNNAFSDCASLTSIAIPDSVTSIGDRAFCDCTSLTSIAIPDSVTSIGGAAFSDCSSLTSVTIPDSVTSIEKGAFSDCASLKAFYGKFASEDNRCLIVKGVLNSFANGYGATSYTIPDSVTSIGEDAFLNCTSLTSVTIPDSVTSISTKAFYECSSLKAFYGKFASEDNRCLIVNRILISFAVKCGATSYTVPDIVTAIGYGAFIHCKSLTTITIPNSVTSIGIYAFGDCTSLTTITIPDGVKSIGNWAFWHCTSLKSLTIPDSVTKIGSDAFYNCTSLTNVTIPNSVTSIGMYAFYNCKSLTSVTIPNSVTKIESYAFGNCTSMKEVYCKPITPPTGNYRMFYNNASGRKIYVPASDDDSIINAYKAKQYWSDYASYIEEYDFSAGQ